MHAALSERNRNPKIFDMILLNFRQFMGWLNSLHSAHDAYLLSLQHVRTLHHVAFAFSAQPLQRFFRYARHAPQYRPHLATNLPSVFISISLIIHSHAITNFPGNYSSSLATASPQSFTTSVVLAKSIIFKRISSTRSGFSPKNFLEFSRPWPRRTSP